MYCWIRIITFFVFLVAVSSEARAHPLVDDAIVSYEDADFRAALRTFNLAARDADLAVEELLLLFEMRALVHHALGNGTAMRQDLERVAALRPGHRLSGLAPPPVRKAYVEMLEAHGGTLGVELVVEEKDFEGKPFVVARVERVPTGLVHHIALQCRVPPSGRAIARTVQGTRARIPLPDSGEHEGCNATAETRRGTVLFEASVEGTSSAAAPLIEVKTPVIVGPSAAEPRQSPAVVPMPEYKEPSDGPVAKKKKKKWPWIVAASALAVAGGVTAGVLISKSSNETQSAPGGVTVTW